VQKATLGLKAPYDPFRSDKPLKSQQMRPPSERTIKPTFNVEIVTLFLPNYPECYHSVPT